MNVRKGQIATKESVAEVCDSLFRAGETITEAAVRAGLGGGSTPVIYRFIRAWEESHLERFLQLESQVEDGVPAGPEGVPDDLWRALVPGWESLRSHAKSEATAELSAEREALAHDREALANDKANLALEAQSVAEREEAWKAERDLWSRQIADLNTQVASDADILKSKQGELRKAQQLQASTDEALRQQTKQREAAEEALREAEARHQADQDRWARQIDQARRDGRDIADRIATELVEANRQLRIRSEEVVTLRISQEQGRQSLAEALQTIEALEAAIKVSGSKRTLVRTRLTAFRRRIK